MFGGMGYRERSYKRLQFTPSEVTIVVNGHLARSQSVGSVTPSPRYGKKRFVGLKGEMEMGSLSRYGH